MVPSFSPCYNNSSSNFSSVFYYSSSVLSRQAGRRASEQASKPAVSCLLYHSLLTTCFFLFFPPTFIDSPGEYYEWMEQVCSSSLRHHLNPSSPLALYIRLYYSHPADPVLFAFITKEVVFPPSFRTYVATVVTLS